MLHTTAKGTISGNGRERGDNEQQRRWWAEVPPRVGTTVIGDGGEWRRVERHYEILTLSQTNACS